MNAAKADLRAERFDKISRHVEGVNALADAMRRTHGIAPPEDLEKRKSELVESLKTAV